MIRHYASLAAVLVALALVAAPARVVAAEEIYLRVSYMKIIKFILWLFVLVTNLNAKEAHVIKELFCSL